MTAITDAASAFFEACETGQGWAACAAYCRPDASFASQAEPLADMTSLADYTEWMKWLLGPIPDGHYELKAFALDEARASVVAFATFKGTHRGAGGPVPPTGKSVSADYVYVMEFDGDKIRHLTKVWNAGWSLRELGWA